MKEINKKLMEACENGDLEMMLSYEIVNILSVEEQLKHEDVVIQPRVDYDRLPRLVIVLSYKGRTLNFISVCFDKDSNTIIGLSIGKDRGGGDTGRLTKNQNVEDMYKYLINQMSREKIKKLTDFLYEHRERALYRYIHSLIKPEMY